MHNPLFKSVLISHVLSQSLVAADLISLRIFVRPVTVFSSFRRRSSLFRFCSSSSACSKRRCYYSAYACANASGSKLACYCYYWLSRVITRCCCCCMVPGSSKLKPPSFEPGCIICYPWTLRPLMSTWIWLPLEPGGCWP